jgi:hypothetical protein
MAATVTTVGATVTVEGILIAIEPGKIEQQFDFFSSFASI